MSLLRAIVWLAGAIILAPMILFIIFLLGAFGLIVLSTVGWWAIPLVLVVWGIIKLCE